MKRYNDVIYEYGIQDIESGKWYHDEDYLYLWDVPYVFGSIEYVRDYINAYNPNKPYKVWLFRTEKFEVNI